MDANLLDPYQFFITQSQSNRWLKSVAADSLKSVKLTVMEWLLIVAIKNNNYELTVTEAAEALGVSLPQITALTQKLIKQELVKQKVISSDRRSRALMLTTKGKELCAKSEEAVRQGLLKRTKDANPFTNYYLLLKKVIKINQ